MTSLKIVLWNANGLVQHVQELNMFLKLHLVDILLVSETHFTDRSFFRCPGYTVYDTRHPDGTAHAGSAIIVKSSIKHYESIKVQTNYLQSTCIVIEDETGPLSISAVYCPPRYRISEEDFIDFFSTLERRFIVGGDYNAKSPFWGSRLTNPRGRTLLKVLQDKNFSHLSTTEFTYWPTDRLRLPDLLDFFITKGVPLNRMQVTSCLDLSSDHSPVIANLNSSILHQEKPPTLYNRHTDWENFKQLIDENITLNLSLKSAYEIDNAVEHFNGVVQEAAWMSTPPIISHIYQTPLPMDIREQIMEKRRLRRIWQRTHDPADKTLFNRASRKLKEDLIELKNAYFQEKLTNLTPSPRSDYSLWKATRYLKRPKLTFSPIRKPDGNWARSSKERAEVFAAHFEKIFQPHEINEDNIGSEEVKDYLESPFQLSPPIKYFTPAEVKFTIHKELKTNKSPGYDLITAEVLKQLPRKGIVLLTSIFNSVLRVGCYPSQWKISQIILIPKPGRDLTLPGSYRPISLLPIASKVFEKLLLKRIKPLINQNNLTPEHQFGFREKHSTTEQIHRITNIIHNSFERKQYCSAAFLDIANAFDKVWHLGLLYKIKKNLPHHYFIFFKSFLTDRYFQIKIQDHCSSLHSIKAGVPQGSILSPFLYTLYTSDLPEYEETDIATFADDTAILASDNSSFEASNKLQEHINKIQDWCNKWKIKINDDKSKHITFALRRDVCPQIQLNGQMIPQYEEVKYLGMHLDRRLTWAKHIWNLRKRLGLKLRDLYWMMNKQSCLSLENKLLLYKCILKPIWTYGLQLWGSASNSNIEKIQRFQSKVLRMVTNAPWYVTNETLHHDLQLRTIKEEIRNKSDKYQQKLNNHVNSLAINLLDNSEDLSRLKRIKILDLPFRFNS